MTAKAPRYLLREKVVCDLLKSYIPGRFLEIGYGHGDFLLTLHDRGFSGLGYDSSPEAQAIAGKLLSEKHIENIALVDEIPATEKFAYVFFFEVIGYLENPGDFLDGLRKNLNPASRVLFSFTNIRHQGEAEKFSGNMACFSRQQIVTLLQQSGYKVEKILNYGYPLSNILRPLLHRYYRQRKESGQNDTVANSGLVYSSSRFHWLNLIVNRVTLLPFFLLQSYFRHSDLGTGYVVVACLLNDEQEYEQPADT